MPLPIPDALETLEDMERLKEYLTTSINTVREDIEENSRFGFSVAASRAQGVHFESNLTGFYYNAQMTQQLDESLHNIYKSLDVFFACYQDQEHHIYNLSTNMIASTAMGVLYDAHEMIEKTGRISLKKTLECLEETHRLVSLIVGKMQDDMENSRRSRPGFK